MAAVEDHTQNVVDLTEQKRSIQSALVPLFEQRKSLFEKLGLYKEIQELKELLPKELPKSPEEYFVRLITTWANEPLTDHEEPFTGYEESLTRDQVQIIAQAALEGTTLDQKKPNEDATPDRPFVERRYAELQEQLEGAESIDNLEKRVDELSDQIAEEQGKIRVIDTHLSAFRREQIRASLRVRDLNYDPSNPDLHKVKNTRLYVRFMCTTNREFCQFCEQALTPSQLANAKAKVTNVRPLAANIAKEYWDSLPPLDKEVFKEVYEEFKKRMRV